MKRALQKIIFPPIPLLAILSAAAYGFVCYILAAGLNDDWTAYAAYAASAWALAADCAAIIRHRQALLHIGERAAASRAAQRLLAIPAAERYTRDVMFRGRVSLLVGAAANFAFAAFRLIVWRTSSSTFALATGGYYIVLGLIRATLARDARKSDTLAQNGAAERAINLEQRCYRRTARLMLLLNLAVGGVTLVMTATGEASSTYGHLIYVSALYTFCSVGAAVTQLIKYRRLPSPLMKAAKAVSLAAAGMSVLVLQTTMITQFSGDLAFMRLMNTLTGGAVFAMIIAMSLFMLIKKVG